MLVALAFAGCEKRCGADSTVNANDRFILEHDETRKDLNGDGKPERFWTVPVGGNALNV